MSEHTPGPWTLSRNTEFLYSGCAGRVRDVQWGSSDVGGVIARVCMWDKSGDQDEAEANARLLAAAPELFSIAQRWAALDGGAWDVRRHARERAELITETRALVRRVTGDKR